METPFTTTLRQFKSLSELECEEETVIQAKSGASMGIQYGTPKADEYTSEPRPCQAALRAFLKALPVAHVFSLAALMYAGRDERDDPVAYWKDLKVSFGTKDEAARAVLDKTPRVEYIDRVAAKVLDLDAIPALIARS
jgi:hypothetical protein